ncbi:hypothetical protein V495_03002 [Pseudogymnoascus sp. VKM F-4514 (FW-929)]|nr:hypothetical protein V495_03002 [Pseudogymnoascus sp. VKM F-4514 (FW-929)]KFY56391.1 hypothetical protein V497_06315 [Pseudogymnoascus sp. VKM F-4516 (FW-969)]
MKYSFAAVTVAASIASAYDLPDNLSQIYNNHKSGACSNELTGGFTDGSGPATFAYCGDVEGAIFLHSSGNGGEYVNMDIDCDGANRTGGKCSNDPTGQGQTAFQSEIQELNVGIDDLDSNLHPYVVFGNEGSSPEFDPRQYGMEPLSVMAVVCNNQVFYGVWGDTNGETSVGEASISLADLCFPDEDLNGNSGHDDKDVLYIGFPGKAAVPSDQTKWSAGNAKDFEDSIKEVGDKLVAGLKA